MIGGATTLRRVVLVILLGIVPVTSGCTIQSTRHEAAPRPNPITLDIVNGVYENGEINLEFDLKNIGDGPLEWIEIEADFSPATKRQGISPRIWSNSAQPLKQSFAPPLQRNAHTKIRIVVPATDLMSYLRESYLLLADLKGTVCISYNDMIVDGSGLPIPHCFNLRVVTRQEYEQIKR